MVTFSTDYWAPAMEVNVRRRQEKSPLTQNGSHYLHNDEHWNTLRQVPTFDSSSSSTGHLSGMGMESPAALKKALYPKPPPVAVTNKKQTLMHKIFHHEPKSSSSSPPSSPLNANPPVEEDPYLLTTASPLEKKNIFNFASVLGRASSFGSERSDTKKPDCTLLKKYGLCDKGNIGQGATAVVRLAHKLSDDDDEAEKLFAVKEFRKRRKNETEKEYVKKLTSEFCISSTLHHENVVETVDLVQDEQHHWCEVMVCAFIPHNHARYTLSFFFFFFWANEALWTRTALNWSDQRNKQKKGGATVLWTTFEEGRTLTRSCFSAITSLFPRGMTIAPLGTMMSSVRITGL